MKLSNNIKILFFVLLFSIIISIFFIPELLSIYKLKKKLNQIEITLDNIEEQKIKFHQKLEDSRNVSDILQDAKNEELSRLKELMTKNSYLGEEIDEGKSDYYLTERRNDEMIGLIKIYEKNKIISNNIINNLKIYFKNNNLKDYYNNISNILTISTIIKNESDINFIYTKILEPFYSNIKNNTKYVLGSPCYKASIDSSDPYFFHKNCSEVGDTIMFIKTNKTRFGGITDLSWKRMYTKEKDYNKTKTRLFNLDNQKIFLYNKNQKVSRHIPPIRAENYYFAIFGYNDLYLGYLPWEGTSSFPQMFLKNNDTDERFNDLLNENIHSFLDEVKFEYEDIEV